MGTQLSVGKRTLAASLLQQEVMVLMAPSIDVLTRDDVRTNVLYLTQAFLSSLVSFHP